MLDPIFRPKPRKARKKGNFKTCKRCKNNFYGKKYSKICQDCDKRNINIRHNDQGFTEKEMEKLIEKRIADFEKKII